MTDSALGYNQILRYFGGCLLDNLREKLKFLPSILNILHRKAYLCLSLTDIGDRPDEAFACHIQL